MEKGEEEEEEEELDGHNLHSTPSIVSTPSLLGITLILIFVSLPGFSTNTSIVFVSTPLSPLSPLLPPPPPPPPPLPHRQSQRKKCP